ncbi:YitT family protein [Cohnella caldifontis]|uniref:YitT family protein n=1 Tax=Cohnella caldifontis TaxID=3027471 RepID=UPI0023EAEE26|nr:YitT family protein [Cohnella sp. YIM B05605]
MLQWKDKLAGVGPYIVMVLGAAAVALGFNLLLVPAKLLSGGLSGISMIFGYVFGWKIAWLYFALNLPILYWGWRVLGKRFIALSVVSFIATSVFLQFVPVLLLTNDRLLASVFGGVLVGIGSAAPLRWGGSSGGVDVVASIVSRWRNAPTGLLIVIFNTAIVAAMGFVTRDWNAALYSMLSIYLSGRIIDIVHTPHRKVTAFIVTKHSQELAARLLAIPRGVTILKTRGAYTSEEHDLLMTVTSLFELAELRRIVRSIDPKAFVNVVQTVDVIGEFRRSSR